MWADQILGGGAIGGESPVSYFILGDHGRKDVEEMPPYFYIWQSGNHSACNNCKKNMQIVVKDALLIEELNEQKRN